MSAQPIQPAIKVGDTVRVKETGMVSANLMTTRTGYGVIVDGRVGVVVAIAFLNGNTAYLLKIDGFNFNHPIPCWHWQVEKLDV